MKIIFDETVSTPLCEIMGRNNSTKGHINIQSCPHNYTTFYYTIFKDMKEKQLRIFELGLEDNSESNIIPGASLYGWAEFFPNSYILGADINKDILFNTDRINTFFCDQNDQEIIKNMWNEHLLLENFDIIIENSKHCYESSVCFFENSIHKLNNNGYYIIENISLHQTYLFVNKIKEWQKEYKNLTFKFLCIQTEQDNEINNLLVIHRDN